MSRLMHLPRALHQRAKQALRGVGVAAGTSVFGHTTPALFVIGAQKSGTTALYRYLGLHPQVACPTTKELNFFASSTAWHNGLATYRQQLPLAWPGQAALTIDASPLYMLDAEQAAPRIQASFPGTAVIAILRDPIARAWSAWHMYRGYHATDAQWFINLQEQLNGVSYARDLLRRRASFGEDFLADLQEEHEALANGRRVDMPIVEFGSYARQITPFLNTMGKDNVLLLTSSELRADPADCLARIEIAAGLSAHDWTREQFTPHFEGNYAEPPPQAAADWLQDLYAPANNELEQLTGIRLVREN
ncbi:MAG: hypothetical protein ACI9DC_002167 [Gammaproteobacteria bacterium]|jgi:hypothetical protein